MHSIGDFFQRLTSRKFLLTVAGITLVTLYPQQAELIVTLIGIYVGGEGIADSVSRYAVEKTKQNNLTVERDKILLAGEEEDYVVDTSKIVSGNATPQSQQSEFNTGGAFPL